MIKRSVKGFTLVELLVAISIFAVLSALGWKTLDYLIKVKDRNAQHEQNLILLQDSYLQIQRDTLQMVPLTANMSGQIQPALILDQTGLKFSKAGVVDPLQQGLSPFERIEYQYKQDERKLYRLKYPNLNVLRTAQPLSSVLLDDIDEFQMTVLNPGEINRWPEDNNMNNTNGSQQKVSRLLPRGLKINFKQRDVEYEWIFSLPNTDYLNKTKT